jgi:alpha-L-rhamnosidase
MSFKIWYYLIVLGFFVITLNSCKERGPARTETVFSGAQWIMGTDQDSIPDSLRFLDHPAPLFRKTFPVKGEIQKVQLYITAAGYYEATLNGSKIGDYYLTPSWTNYAKRIYYDTYDLTGKTSDGINCLTVELGNGYYNPLPLWMWGNLNLRKHLPVGTPSVIAKLVIEYKNGEKAEIVSDQSWKFTDGPIRRNNVYRGEYYDARKEIAGWNTANFDDGSWKKANLAKDPGGELQPIFFPPIRVVERVDPIAITEPEPGVYVFDMGQNYTGLFEAKVKGNPGDSIYFTFGERIYDDGKLNPMTAAAGQIKRNKQYLNLGATRVSKQQHCYIIGESGSGVYSPKFSFHTYRYAEVRGLKYKPDLKDFTGLLMHSDVKSAGELLPLQIF